MKTFKKIVAVAAVLFGIIFLLNAASDIQLSAGVILIAVGILGFPETVKTEVY